MRDEGGGTLSSTTFCCFEIKLFTHSGGNVLFSNLLWRLVTILMRCEGQTRSPGHEYTHGLRTCFIYIYFFA